MVSWLLSVAYGLPSIGFGASTAALVKAFQLRLSYKSWMDIVCGTVLHVKFYAIQVANYTCILCIFMPLAILEYFRMHCD